MKPEESHSRHEQQHGETGAPGDERGEYSCDVGCHVLSLPAFLSRASKNAPNSPTLSPELLQLAAECAAGWRDVRYVAARLETLREDKRLPGIAVCYYDRKEPAIPPPIPVPFEPVPLDEREPVIRGIMESAVPPAGTRPRAIDSTVGRWMLRGFLPLILVINIVSQMVVQGIVQQGVARLWVIAIYAVSLVLLFLGFGIAYQLSDRWFLVPGGVLRRKSLLRMLRGPIHRHVPRDTVLILWSFPIGGCRAELWQNGAVSRRYLTEFERNVLLGAWQSPLPAPPLARMTDLLGAHDIR